MGVAIISWMALSIHPLCHQQQGEMAANALYLQNNLTTAP
jgi:hypothetical protein